MLVMLVMLALGTGEVAHADEVGRDVYAERPVAVMAHAGLGAPLGLLGIAADVAVRPWLGVEGGIGRGMSGTQLAVTGRARVARAGSSMVAFGLGMSGGRYEHRAPFFGIEYDATGVRRALWTNAEISLEQRSRGGFQLRLYAGVATIVAGDREYCSGLDGRMTCSGTARGLWGPYVGLSLGFAIGL